MKTLIWVLVIVLAMAAIWFFVLPFLREKYHGWKLKRIADSINVEDENKETAKKIRELKEATDEYYKSIKL